VAISVHLDHSPMNALNPVLAEASALFHIRIRARSFGNRRQQDRSGCASEESSHRRHFRYHNPKRIYDQHTRYQGPHRRNISQWRGLETITNQLRLEPSYATPLK